MEKNMATLPAKLSMKEREEGVFFNTMPVILPNRERAGVKIVTRYPDRVPSISAEIILYDNFKGNCIAMMDGTWITTMRTGAVTVHSIKQFAVKDFKVIGMIGLGNIARATLDILLDVFPGRQLVIKLKKYKDQHMLFINRYEEYSNLKFEVCDTYSEVISESDIILSAVTYFDEDICLDKECYKKGVTLIPIHTMGFTNCDLFFDKVYVDDIAHVSGFKNFKKFKSVAEVSDVIKNKITGRENNDERILVYNVGIALHDIYFANKIYNIVSDEMIKEVNFENINKKYWV